MAEHYVFRSLDGGATWKTETIAGIDYLPQAISVLDANTAVLAQGSTDLFSSGLSAAISDYGGAPNNWTGTGTNNMFGVCIQAVGLSATLAGGWTADTTNTPGQCQANDVDPWAALPATSTKVAYTTVAGQSGRVDFVWGVRMASNQPAGAYSAGVVFGALAPDA
jgi:hypothetical protein